jgi:nucleoside-diphosphate-sugar epimerase
MITQPKILITGASGFIGSALVTAIASQPDFCVVRASRTAQSANDGEEIRLFDLLDSTQMPRLDDVHAVIHTAARVHVMGERMGDGLEAFRTVNVQGTIALANAAASAGVKRFIYLSSIKVNGEETVPGQPFTSFDVPAPLDAYGISKHEAEQALWAISKATGMEVVVVRPPLVYGPGVKANFASMMKWLELGLPLPLGAIDNRRSLVSVGNLVDLLIQCVRQPSAADQTFLVSDAQDLSTTQLLKQVALAIGKKPHLLPVPSWLLRMCASMLGKGNFAQRLCGSLQVDINHTCERLHWTPPFPIDASLRLTAEAFLAKPPN